MNPPPNRMHPQRSVWVVPDYRKDNPYQSLLADAIAANSPWRCAFYPHYHRGLPFTRAVNRLRPRPDCLHLHWTDTFTARVPTKIATAFYMRKVLLDLALLKARRIPFVYTLHNEVSHDCAFPALELNFQRRLARAAHRVILHQSTLRSQLATDFNLPQSHFHVIPHGLYHGCYGDPIPTAAARTALNLPAEPPLFLFFGMLRPYKGVDAILTEWPAVLAANPNAILLIVGHAPDPAYRQHLIESAAKLQNVRIIPEFVEDARVPTLLCAATAVVFPFRKVLTSGSVLLALSFRRPVIAPAFPALQEAIAPLDSLLYPPNDPAGLRNALLNAATLAHAQLPWHALENRLDWAAIASQTAALYQSAVT